MNDQRREYVWLTALTLGALLLRLPRLETIPPGFLVDEAIEGLQGVALWSGERLPDLPEQGPAPSMPLWAGLVAVSTRVFGVTLASARLPAAIIGTLSIPLTWWVVRALLGRAAAWTAAVFLCGSFWHVQYSRQSMPWVTLVGEGLGVCWLLLAPRAAMRPAASAAAGLVAGLACYEYQSAFALVLWGMVVVALRATTSPRRQATMLGVAFIAGLAVALAPMILGIHGRVLIQRITAIHSSERNLPVSGLLIPWVNLFADLDAPVRQWTGYPAGAARLSVLSRFLILVGLAGLVLLRSVPLLLRIATGLWIISMLLPEAVPRELHLSRGVGALAPLALLAGFAGRLVWDRLGRWAVAVGLAACLLDAAWSAKRLYIDYANDPRVKQSFQSTDTEAARFVARMCLDGPVRIPASSFTYEDNPVLRYHLWNEIHRALVIPMTPQEILRTDFKPTIDFFRRPVNGEPSLFILGTDRYPTDRRICLMSIGGLMETGRRYEREGRFGMAESYYRNILSLFPDSAWTWTTLARLLVRQGRHGEAARAFAEARRFGYADPQ